MPQKFEFPSVKTDNMLPWKAPIYSEFFIYLPNLILENNSSNYTAIYETYPLGYKSNRNTDPLVIKLR